MYICPRKGRTNSFEEAREAYQREINQDVRAYKGDGEAAADPDPDNSAVITPERPHRPWLVAGRG